MRENVIKLSRTDDIRLLNKEQVEMLQPLLFFSRSVKALINNFKISITQSGLKN